MRGCDFLEGSTTRMSGENGSSGLPDGTGPNHHPDLRDAFVRIDRQIELQR